MTQAQHEAWMARIDRTLAQRAEFRGDGPRAAGLATFVLAFVTSCMATGAAIVAATIVLTRAYL